MMKRRIFLWMGLIILFLSLGICQEGVAGEKYKVKRGDTLTKISSELGVSLQALKKANKLKSSALKPSQILIIPQQTKKKLAKPQTSPPPEMQYYTVKKGDTIFGIAKKTGLSVKEIKKMNRLRADKLKIGKKLALSNPLTIKKTATRAVASVGDTKKVAISEGESEDNGKDDGKNDDGGLSGEDNGIDLGKDEGANANMEPLGKWDSPDERKIFVRVVKGFLGTPYRFGGSSIRGLDCSAFVKKIYQFFGINLPRTAREQSYVGKRVPRNELEEGDLVFFHTRRAIGHVGIYVGNNQFIHASFRNKEVRLDSLESPYYDKRFIRAVRVKGLDGEV